MGSIVNFALMYLLAPTGAAGAAAGSQSLIARMFSEQTLLAWGAPGGHMFQPGFPVAKRALNFVYKGCIFSLIGMFAGLVGTSISNGLLVVRQKLDPTFISQVGGAPPLPSTAAAAATADTPPPPLAHRNRTRPPASWATPRAGRCTWACPPTCATRCSTAWT